MSRRRKYLLWMCIAAGRKVERCCRTDLPRRRERYRRIHHPDRPGDASPARRSSLVKLRACPLTASVSQDICTSALDRLLRSRANPRAAQKEFLQVISFPWRWMSRPGPAFCDMNLFPECLGKLDENRFECCVLTSDGVSCPAPVQT